MNIPLIYEWSGEAMVPLPRFRKEADKVFVVHERYHLEEIKPRDMIKHKRQFAFVNDAWENLDEKYADEPWAQSAEHLRKFALIKTGYCNTDTLVASSKAEALRLAAFIRPMDTYAIITTQGSTVYRFTAMSQSVRAMGAELFYESRKKVMEFVAGLIGADAKTLEKAGESA